MASSFGAAAAAAADRGDAPSPPAGVPFGSRFIDALSFEGPRPGYYFGTGDEGTGYYRDRAARPSRGAMAPPAPRRPRNDGDGAGGPSAAAGAFDDADDDDPAAKRARLAQGHAAAASARGQELLARAEAEAGGEGALADLAAAAPTDARGARRLLAALAKRADDNVRLRARHPDEPMRFLESEVDIMGALRALAGLAASPELYWLLYKSGGGGGAKGGGGGLEDGDGDGGGGGGGNGPSSSATTNKHLECILGLLAHDNADIGCEVLSLLQELTGTDDMGGDGGGGGGGSSLAEEAAAQRAAARALARAVVAAGGLELVAQRATTLDEAASPEEAQGLLAALGLAENLSALLGAGGALAVCRRAPALLRWMLSRVKRRARPGAAAAGAGGGSADASAGDDPVKLAAAETLAAMLMGAEGAAAVGDDEEEEGKGSGGAPENAAAAVAEAVVAAGGVDALLRAAAPFRARDPNGAEEAELLENIFGALAALLSAPSSSSSPSSSSPSSNKSNRGNKNSSNSARAAFLADEGVELCVLMLRSRRPSRAGALRALDFAATRCPAVARAFVEKGGLGPLFGLFMGRSKLRADEEGGGGDHGKNKKKKKAKARMALDRDGERELEERTVSLLASLFVGLAAEAAEEEKEEEGSRAGPPLPPPPPPPPPPSSSSSSSALALLDRLTAKFVESEHEKLDRLVELLMRHAESAGRAERELEEEAELERGGGGDDGALPPTAAERALARLGAGDFPAQCCACCAAFLWASGEASLRSRLLSLLHLRGRTLQLVRQGVRGRVAALDEAAAAEAPGEEQGGGAAGAAATSPRRPAGDAAERARELRALRGALAALGG